MRHGHGDDGYRWSRPVRADFSSNVRPDGPAPALCDHLASMIPQIGRYPEAAAESFARQFAEANGIVPGQVLVTSGAVAAIYLVAQAWSGHCAGIVVPTFAEYEDASRLHRIGLKFMDREELAAGGADGCDLLWLCDPNNPTGEVISRGELLALVDRHPGTMFALDVVYADFCAAAPVRPVDAAARHNLLLIHSLTKKYAIPGLRLGAITGSIGTTAKLAQGAPPWAVNTMALAAGEYCLRHRMELALPLSALLAEATRLQTALAGSSNVRVQSSATTFFLFELDGGTSAGLKRHLLERHGLLIRDAANFRGLGPRHVRVATQTPEKNDWLVEAVHQWKP